jgi:hypothetical protein
MQFVYLCRSGSNEELKYSIRSLVKHFPNPDIVVVGGKPDWYIGEHISVQQNKTKHQNVINSLYSICSSEKINETFVLMNDDFFITRDISEIPVFHGGLLKDKVLFYQENADTSNYTKILIDTQFILQKQKIENPLDYAIHVPMTMEKKKLLKILKPMTSFRILYGNLYSVGGTKIPDVKFYNGGPLWAKSYMPESNEIPFLSTNDQSFQKAYSLFLKHNLNKKTIYEK